MARAADHTSIIGADISDFEDSLLRAERRAQAFGARVSRLMAGEAAPRPRPESVSLYREQGARAGRGFSNGFLEGLSSTRDPFLALSRNAGSAAAAVGLAFGAREAVQMADAWQNSANRLSLITENLGQAGAYHRQLYDLSQQTRTETEATVQLFHRLSTSTENLPRGHKELLDVTRAVNQSFAISGATAQESAAAIQQFGQALASNRLGGEEFRSISEMAPRLRDAIADALDVNIGKLREMAEAGQLTSSVVFGAITEMADEINAEFEIVETTISGAFQRLSNAAGRFVGETGQITGATRALSDSINFVADNFGRLMNVAAAFAALLAARFAGRVFDTMVVSIRGAIDGFRAQREQLIATTYARNIDAKVAEQSATRDLALTNQRIANLQRVEQSLVRAARLERDRIQSYHAITGGGTVDRNAAGQFRAAADRQRIQRALQRGNLDLEMSERRLIAIENQQIATQRRLAASTAQLTVARKAEEMATNASTMAGNRHSASLAAQNIGAKALAGGMALVNTAYNAMGGAAGLAILAITGVVLWFQNQKQAAEEAAQAIEDWKAKAEALSPEERESLFGDIEADINAADAQFRQAERMLQEAQVRREDIIDKMRQGEGNRGELLAELRLIDIAQLQNDRSEAEEHLTSLMTKMEDLQEVERRVMNSGGDNTGVQDAARKAQIKHLAELRDIGEAQKQEYEQIERVLAAHNEELARLQTEAPTLTDDTAIASNQIRRLEIKVDIRELTKETQWERDLKQRMSEAARREEARIRGIRDRAKDALANLELSLDTQQADSVVSKFINDVLASEREITAEIEKQGGWEKARSELLQDQLDLLNAFNVSEIRLDLDVPKLLKLTPVIVPGRLDNLIRTINEQMAEIEMFDVMGNDGAERLARQSRDASMRLLVQRLEEGKYTATQIKEILEEAGLTTEDIDRAFGRLDRFDFDSVVALGRGLLQVANSADLISDRFNKIADGILGMMTAVDQVQEAMENAKAGEGLFSWLSDPTALSGIVAGIGGIVSIFDGLFGNSGPTPLEIALDKNRQSIDRMRASYERNLDILGEQSAFSFDIDQLMGSLGREFFNEGKKYFGMSSDRDYGFEGANPADFDFIEHFGLERLANEFGLSLAELEEAAEHFGIQIRDGEGRWLVQGFVDLQEKMALAAEEALRLKDTFSDMSSVFEAERDLRNLEDPVDVWNDVVEMAGTLLPPSLARAFDNIDISSVEGQQAARQFLIDLFEKAKAGDLNDMLMSSGFETVQEFIEFLVYAEDPLDNLADAADQAAEALRDINLPPGFRSEFSQWANTIPGLGEITPANPIIVEQPVFNIPVTSVPPAPTPPRHPYEPERVRPNVQVTIASGAFTYTGSSAEEGYRQTRERVMAAARASENPMAAIAAMESIFPEV